MHIGKTLISITVGMKLTTDTHQFCNKYNINISLMWADRYLKNTLQLKFPNNFELARVLASGGNFEDTVGLTTRQIRRSLRAEKWGGGGQKLNE
jgi:hypothetical protein